MTFFTCAHSNVSKQTVAGNNTAPLAIGHGVLCCSALLCCAPTSTAITLLGMGAIRPQLTAHTGCYGQVLCALLNMLARAVVRSLGCEAALCVCQLPRLL